MKPTKTSWPRHIADSIKCRPRDLIIRISNWTRDKDEPAYDVEVYIKGIYDWNESKVFSTRNANRSKPKARKLAIQFAQQQIEKHMESFK
jgi:hypothetical protein